ncbi:hypothetical protein IFO70_01305 [Phormidium tenue FACHB-886]|nr:hypothetical protein [Phormidium tenue FACHB-886]
MSRLKALIYLEQSNQIETLIVEFKCWEHLYESIQAVQIAHPTAKAGLERLLDTVPQDFPVFEWQVRWGRPYTMLQPAPITAR